MCWFISGTAGNHLACVLHLSLMKGGDKDGCLYCFVRSHRSLMSWAFPCCGSVTWLRHVIKMSRDCLWVRKEFSCTFMKSLAANYDICVLLEICNVCNPPFGMCSELLVLWITIKSSGGSCISASWSVGHYLIRKAHGEVSVHLHTSIHGLLHSLW